MYLVEMRTVHTSLKSSSLRSLNNEHLTGVSRALPWVKTGHDKNEVGYCPSSTNCIRKSQGMIVNVENAY